MMNSGDLRCVDVESFWPFVKALLELRRVHHLIKTYASSKAIIQGSFDPYMKNIVVPDGFPAGSRRR